ncbi:hypothetical protein SEUCBS139899_009417 [Sporothrix eucalyptigena]
MDHYTTTQPGGSPSSSPPRLSIPASTTHTGDTPRFRPRACARCSTSKLKCNWGTNEPGEGPCERCARTKAECTLPTLKPRGPRRTNPTRVGQLEQKLDGIMSLLTASKQIQTTPSTSRPATLDTPPDNDSPASVSAPGVSTAAPSPESDPLPPLANVLRYPPLDEVDITPGLKVSFADADRALAEYSSTYAPHFPFVPLPTNINPYDLYQTQPLLFRVIVQIVVPQTPQVQRDAKRWFREQIALHVVTNEEKDVSLLQAILLYVAWSDLGFYIDPKVTPLLQIAAGLVSDLGLHRPVHHEMSMTLNAFIADAATALRGFGYERPVHTLQSMRAALGCYYVCSLSSSFFRRIPVFPFTAYMDDCCEQLLQANEFPSDALAVALARMQRVAARIYAVLPNPEGGDAPPAAAFAPVYMGMATLRQELDQFVHGTGDTPPLSPSVQNNCFLWTHYHAILVRLYEPSIYLRLRKSSSVTNLADTGLRTEALWNCLQATRDFFDAYSAVPPAVLGVLPLLGTAHLSFSIVTLTRLLSLDAPEWHIGQARRSFDFVALALRLEQQFAAADDHEQTLTDRKKRYANMDNRTILTTHRDKMRWIRIWYTTKMPPDPHQLVRPYQTQAGRASLAPATASTTSVGSMTTLNTPVSSTSSALLPQQQPLPFPFQTAEPPAPATAQQQSMMDVDTETSNDRQVVLPDGLTVPLDEFDSTFWKAIFDLDSSTTWEPSMGQ